LALATAVFDDRYAEGRLFADTIAATGVRAQALRDGDVTDAYLALDRLWRERPAAIAGFTQFGPMFVLERLARERGLRVAMRIEHEMKAEGMLTHTVTGPPDMLALAAALQQQSPEWAMLSAALAAHCRGDCLAPAERTIATPGAKPVLTRPASGSDGVP